MGAVSNIVGAVGDLVGGAVEAVGDIGSFVDDAVNDVVPGGWATVGAAALGFGGLEALGGLGELGEAASLAEGATGLSSLPSSVLSAGDAFATGSQLAGGASGLTGLASLPDSVLSAAEAFGTGGGNIAVDAANLAGASASNTPSWVQQITGGTDFTNVPVGGGFTSLGEQAANFAPYDPSSLNALNQAIQASNALNGIPNGITSSTPQVPRVGSSVAGGNTIVPIIASGLSGGQVQTPASPSMNVNPFNFGKTEPVQATQQQNPVYLGQLAQLLRG